MCARRLALPRMHCSFLLSWKLCLLERPNSDFLRLSIGVLCSFSAQSCSCWTRIRSWAYWCPPLCCSWCCSEHPFPRHCCHCVQHDSSRQHQTYVSLLATCQSFCVCFKKVILERRELFTNFLQVLSRVACFCFTWYIAWLFIFCYKLSLLRLALKNKELIEPILKSRPTL